MLTQRKGSVLPKGSGNFLFGYHGYLTQPRWPWQFPFPVILTTTGSGMTSRHLGHVPVYAGYTLILISDIKILMRDTHVLLNLFLLYLSVFLSLILVDCFLLFILETCIYKAVFLHSLYSTCAYDRYHLYVTSADLFDAQRNKNAYVLQKCFNMRKQKSAEQIQNCRLISHEGEGKLK